MKTITILIIIFNLIRFSYSQTYWIQTNGPKAAWANCITSNSSGNIYCGTNGAGIYWTSNGGQNWNNFVNSPNYVIVIGFGLNGVIFAGIDIAGVGNSGLYKSTDYGNTWNLVNDYGTKSIIGKRDGYIFCGTSPYFLRSTNNGVNWTTLTDGLENSRIYTIDTLNNETIFAGGYNSGKIFRSTNNGDNWQRVYYTGLNNDIKKIKCQNNKVYAIIDSLYCSTNLGVNWVRINTNNVFPKDLEITQDNILIISDSYNIFLSTNEGLTWSSRPNCVQFPFSSFRDLFVDSGNNFYTSSVGYENGLFKFNFTYMCHNISESFINSQVKAMVSQRNGYIYASTGFGSIYLSSNSGNSWNEIFRTESHYPVESFCIDSSNRIYAATHGGIYRSTNNGLNWSFFSSVFYDEYVYSIIASPSGSLFAWKYNSGIYKSTNAGVNWSLIFTGYSYLKLSVSSNGDIYLGYFMPATVYRSTDDGATWNNINNNTQFWAVNSVYVTNNDLIFVGSVDGIFRSTNYGNNWIKVSQEGEIISFTSNNLGYIYGISEDNGIYYSPNYGNLNSWSFLNNGLYNLHVNSIIIDSYGYLYAGTDGRGVFKSTFPTSINFPKTPILDKFSLHQNYPNPFNPVTKIKFSIPKNTTPLNPPFNKGGTDGDPSPAGVFVSLIVYDILGREIVTLINEQLKPGTYEVEWDGTNYASGIYYYRLVAGDFVETRKMVLIR